MYMYIACIYGYYEVSPKHNPFNIASATSIIWTSFIRNLDYPDLLETHKYITMHAQRAWLMILWGVVTVELWAKQFYRVVLAKKDWPVYIYECCWPWSHYIGIV